MPGMGQNLSLGTSPATCSGRFRSAAYKVARKRWTGYTSSTPAHVRRSDFVRWLRLTAVALADFDQMEPLRGAKIALDHLKLMFELHVVTSRQADIEQQTRRFVQQLDLFNIEQERHLRLTLPGQ